MLYAVLLLLSSIVVCAADSPKVGDPVPMEFAGMLLSALKDETKTGDPVAVKDYNNQWTFAKFSGRYGEGKGAQVAIVNEKGHGFLVPVANVQSITALKKLD